MPTYHKVVTEGRDTGDDIRNQILHAAQTWTAQGSRIVEAQLSTWRFVKVLYNDLETDTLTGKITVEEELLGRVHVNFRISISYHQGRQEAGCVVSLLYQTHHSNYNHHTAQYLQVPYCILGANKPWHGMLEAFAWSMSDYIELMVDPDEVHNLGVLSESM